MHTEVSSSSAVDGPSPTAAIRQAIREAGGIVFALVLLAVMAAGCSGSSGTANLDVGSAENVPALTPTSVVPYALGPDQTFGPDDLRPMMSEGEGYTEKWEFRAYSRPYQIKLKWEVANLGFGDYKGRVTGYLKDHRLPDGEDRWKISAKFGEDSWKRSKSGEFSLTFGDWRIEGVPGRYHLVGEADDGRFEFEFDIEGRPWRPGTGLVVLGDEDQVYFKHQVLIAQGRARGVVRVDGESVETEGRVYANHFATNGLIHEVADRFYRFRKHTDDLFVEWRRFELSKEWKNQTFGYIVVWYGGELIFESWDANVLPHEYWTDPDHYNYTIPRGLTIEAEQSGDKLRLKYDVERVDARDPLANLPALERNVASRFAQPMAYTLHGTWRLDLLVDGIPATIEEEGSYTVTAFR